MIRKSFSGLAAGALLVGGGAIATAQAGPFGVVQAPPSPTVQAPRSGGDGYEADIYTRTSVTVGDVRVGQNPVARVVVRAGATKATPRGTVTVRIAGESRSATLRGGEARITMPKMHRAGRYAADATYSPAKSTEFKRSSASTTFRVLRRR